ncbi:hypothetical protein BBD42_27295 [Paenibacillus sp. BIHB 4019]|uniref:DUF2515 domain-containing protein n=1 Tax=Paenibacillus sp. BIHB 4019 TaxID=1870819 RepID=A0A1B2DQ19_9BACL|nr:DUF2515 domain-containing protein [Paenibacillus sp. BIHB 4019]ANY69788.1 hypothetical protein BBD42_27295 [Paenibacillus sp. BIHB 4019]
MGGAVGKLGSGFRAWLRRCIQLPADAWLYAVGKWHSFGESQKMAAAARPLVMQPAIVAKLAASWTLLEREQEAGGSNASPNASPNANSHVNSPMNSTVAAGQAEYELLAAIRADAVHLNRNNVTRTEAYLAIYERRPELHWALLAHLVSRNGGWNMTDLQGEWLPYLLGRSAREAVFRFLERANALIFQDAFPQLLLYEASCRAGRPLFYLLPQLGVSRFMVPVWQTFWESGDSAILTVALIVNEQNYIEKRIVQHPFFRKEVLDTVFFGLQSLLQLNAVVFCYRSGGEEMKLAGLILENFDNLKERIEFGKRLYALLFSVPEVHGGAIAFARAIRHTGSRADYAPHLFAAVRRDPPKKPYRERLSGRRLAPGAAPLFSPKLSSVWPDRAVEAPESGDWFQQAAQVLPYFQKLPLPHSFEMTNEYSLLLNKIELAVLASQQWKP